MSLAVCHSQCLAPAASSQRGAASSSIRAPLRCFTAAVRGQQLVQQRAAVRAQRAAVVARAALAEDEEEQQYEEVRAGLANAPLVGPARAQAWRWCRRAPPSPLLMPPPAAALAALQDEDQFQERVVQIRRVTKVVKGGKQLSFRAVVSARLRGVAAAAWTSHMLANSGASPPAQLCGGPVPAPPMHGQHSRRWGARRHGMGRRGAACAAGLA